MYFLNFVFSFCVLLISRLNCSKCSGHNNFSTAKTRITSNTNYYRNMESVLIIGSYVI